MICDVMTLTQRHCYVSRSLPRDFCVLEDFITLEWRHNGHDGVWNHQPHGCVLSRLFRRRSKKTPKLRVTGLCEGNSPVTGEFPSQRASNAENVSSWWRHQFFFRLFCGDVQKTHSEPRVVPSVFVVYLVHTWCVMCPTGNKYTKR